jgi:hypothetical protein
MKRDRNDKSKVEIMKKIVLAAHPENEHTETLVRLLEILFPECKVQVSLAEAENPEGKSGRLFKQPPFSVE